MTTRPAQSTMRSRPPPDPHVASLADHRTTGGIASGDVIYIRARVVSFTTDFDGVRVATCTPIERDGKPCQKDGARCVYYAPVEHLVRADVVTAEIRAKEGPCSPKE